MAFMAVLFFVVVPILLKKSTLPTSYVYLKKEILRNSQKGNVLVDMCAKFCCLANDA